MGERDNLETGAEAKKMDKPGEAAVTTAIAVEAGRRILDTLLNKSADTHDGSHSINSLATIIQAAIDEATTALVAERNDALLTIRLDSYRDYDENAFAAFQNRRYLAKLIGKMLDFSNEDLNKISDISVEDHFEEGLRDGAQYLRAFVKQVVQERDKARAAARELGNSVTGLLIAAEWLRQVASGETQFSAWSWANWSGVVGQAKKLKDKHAALLADPEQKPNK